MAELIRNEMPLADWPAEWFAIEDNIRRADILLGCTMLPGDALKVSLARGSAPAIETASNERSWREAVHSADTGPGATLEEIKKSGLRGRGGAGFTTGLKWEACRNAPGTDTLCRLQRRRRRTRHLQGSRAADAPARSGFRGHDRRRLRDRRQQGLSLPARRIPLPAGTPERGAGGTARKPGLLGKNILGRAGFDFDIEIHLGAGAYICGEESALIESLEGKRGVPRNRPPFPVTHGFLDQPTVVNNVETFAAAALIAAKGGDWYRSFGTAKSAGTKILSISGDCERPGIYEYPFGVSVRQVLEECGAKNTQAVQISGPSGICIGPDEFDRRIAFEDIPTAGAFMVFDSSRDMFEVVRNFVHFFAHESCGFCTPCRVGTTLLKNLMDKIAAGHGTRYDLNEIFNLNRVLQTAAHCGLGHTACNPLLHTLEKFRPAYERRLKSLDFEPAFDLDAALSQARQMTGRDDAGAHLSNELETTP